MTVEADIERHLAKRVKELGGEVRKVQWPGRRHAPDRLVLLPDRMAAFVELKRPGDKPRAGQLREHDRLRKACLVVVVFDTKEAIDVWLGIA